MDHKAESKKVLEYATTMLQGEVGSFDITYSQAFAQIAQAHALIALCERLQSIDEKLDLVLDEGNGAIRTSTWMIPV